MLTNQFVEFFGADLSLECVSLVLSSFSIVCDADLMSVTISLSCCSLERFSNSRPGTVLARRKMRSVGSLRVVVSRASVGQWLNWDRFM